MSDTLVVRSPTNPLDVRVNSRFYGSQALPPAVREGILAIFHDTQRAVEEQGYDPGLGYVQMDITFTFASNRGDIDGPLKRTIDAVADGIKRSGYPKFHDGKVKKLVVRRRTAADEGGSIGIEVLVKPWSRT